MIALYENVAELTGRMLDAARNGDWDGLTELESCCARQIDTLNCNAPSAPLTRVERARKVELIHRILADDRAIRVLVEPRMTRLAALLDSTRTERKLSRSYGVAEGL